MKKSFEEEYKKEKFYLGIEPHQIVETALDYVKSGRALDLGVGEGRDAVFLAKKGFDVTGLDISETGIRHFLELAKKEKVNVTGTVEDIAKFEFEENYDLLISLSTFQFIERKEILKVIARMKEHTKEAGINVITAFNEDNPYKEFAYLFKKNELKDFYSGWEILEYKEEITPLEKHGKDERPHRHGITSIIARKPKK
ncbi:MAG: methyltransferase domain-containing protein [Nanoarchaeota archaeon]